MLSLETKRKIVFLLSIILVVGACIFYYLAKINSCRYLLEKQVQKLGPEYSGIRTVLYFINEVNTLCRPCAEYEILKDEIENLFNHINYKVN